MHSSKGHLKLASSPILSHFSYSHAWKQQCRLILISSVRKANIDFSNCETYSKIKSLEACTTALSVERTSFSNIVARKNRWQLLSFSATCLLDCLFTREPHRPSQNKRWLPAPGAFSRNKVIPSTCLFAQDSLSPVIHWYPARFLIQSDPKALRSHRRFFIPQKVEQNLCERCTETPLSLTEGNWVQPQSIKLLSW